MTAAEPKHWPEDFVSAAVATARSVATGQADPESLTLTTSRLLGAAVILADHVEWTRANLEKRMKLWVDGFANGMQMRLAAVTAERDALAEELRKLKRKPE